MNEKDFLAYNLRFRQRQTAIRAERRRTELIRLGELIPGVMAEIEKRQRMDAGERTR